MMHTNLPRPLSLAAALALTFGLAGCDDGAEPDELRDQAQVSLADDVEDESSTPVEPASAELLVEPEVLDGSEGQVVLYNGDLTHPATVLRWPDGSQVDIYTSRTGAVAMAAKTPLGSPYRAVINQARGIEDAEVAFATLAPTQAVPASLRIADDLMAEPVEPGEPTFTDEGLAYLADAGLTPADVELTIEGDEGEPTESQGSVQHDGDFELTDRTDVMADGCFHTAWFLNYIATTYPWPANPWTCWWHSPQYVEQWVSGTHWDNYEYGFMTDHGSQMEVLVVVTERAFFNDGWFYNANNWIWVHDLNPSWAQTFWVLGLSGATTGRGGISGTNGASHMAWEHYM